MRRALVGHTGFVGGALRAAGGFTDMYNSKNVECMAGERFDEIVCAGIPAVKWLANKEPEADRAVIRRLTDVLATVETGRFVLISTVDVYPDTAQPLDEDADPAGLPNHAYGRHRLAVERWVAERFPAHAVIRLPALFGEGLKKNALFDLLHDNQVEKINPASLFQWYPTWRLPGDIGRVAAAGLTLVNLVTEPLAMRDVIARLFPGAPVGPETDTAPRYALRTRHAALFGGAPPYILRADEVLSEMGDFVEGQRRG